VAAGAALSDATGPISRVGFVSPQRSAARDAKSNPLDAFAWRICAETSVWNPSGKRLRHVCGVRRRVLGKGKLHHAK
jgi:hypothetical protein